MSSTAVMTTTALGDRPPDLDAPTHADVDADLRELARLVRDREQRMLRLVMLLDRICRSGLVEALEGLPVEQVLALRFNLTRGEVWMLQTAGQCLRDMPATARLWREGVISWSQVRQIVERAKRLPREARQVLDARLDASRDLFDALDPDRLAWAVDRAADELRGLKAIRDAERRRDKANFISVQTSFDGTGTIYGQMDPVALSTVVGAWDAAANDLHAAGHDLPTRPAQRRAAGAVAAAGDYLTGHPHHHRDSGDGNSDSGDGGEADGSHHGCGRRARRARPLVNLVVDVADCTATSAGQVLVDAPGALPTITRTRLQQILETDHDCRAVLFDGERPLAVSDLVRAERLSGKTRLAVQLRDRGSRMPASRTPTGQTHIHHLDKPRHGHHPDHLICLGPHDHLTQVHKRGWQLQLEPDTAQLTATWNHRTYRTLPWATPLRRAPDPDDDDGPPRRTPQLTSRLPPT